MPPHRCYGSRLLAIGLCAVLLSLNTTLAKPPKGDEAKSAKNAAEKKTNKQVEFPEEDSDMLMEPNDFLPVTVVRSHERQFHSPPSHDFIPIANPHVTSASPRIDRLGHVDSHSQAAQNYYPPFFREAPPLGHSRPYFPIPDGPPLPKFAAPHPENSPPVHQQQRAYDTAILGSGDFGILRGGTFYPEDEMPYHPDDNGDFFYGDANNGHGRPSTEEFIQKYTYPEEQFANFRDFADINTPADSAFSQFVVVYAAKNSTKPTTHPRPKNIFEQLELLDREKALEQKEKQKQQKQQKQRSSKSKSKLSKTKLQKKYTKKSSPKDLDYEPLLALS